MAERIQVSHAGEGSLTDIFQQEAVTHNAIYECSPTRKSLNNETSEMVMNLRPRVETKELSRHFRFKPTNQAERIADTISANTGQCYIKSVMVSKDRRSPRRHRHSIHRSTNESPSVDSYGRHKSPVSKSGLTTRLSQVDSTMRSSTVRRTTNTDRARNTQQRVTRTLNLPFNKTVYAKMAEEQVQPKTFFKGAVEFLQANERSSLADTDDGLKKILDDSLVHRKYKEHARQSQELDLVN